MEEKEMFKVTIITRREKLHELREALQGIGVMGITVTMVEGCGTQLGQTEQYRGNIREIRFLPKVQVEVVISTVPVSEVIGIAEKVLRTGKIGDGKVFVSRISRVVRIRTGEENAAALTN
jgi:nitrogen regulatory protein PII